MGTHRRRSAVLVSSLLLVFAGNVAPAAVLANPDPVSTTFHRQLGFEADVPFDVSDGDSEEACIPVCFDVASYSVHVVGTAHIRVAMGVDVTFSYDPADVLPSSSVPISVTYTPTNDPGDELSLDVEASTIDFDGCVVEVLCTGGTLHGVTLAQGFADFAALMSGDAPVVVPLSSDTINFSTITGTVADASLDGSMTLGPVPSGGFAGLGWRALSSRWRVRTSPVHSSSRASVSPNGRPRGRPTRSTSASAPTRRPAST